MYYFAHNIAPLRITLHNPGLHNILSVKAFSIAENVTKAWLRVWANCHFRTLFTCYCIMKQTLVARGKLKLINMAGLHNSESSKSHCTYHNA